MRYPGKGGAGAKLSLFCTKLSRKGAERGGGSGKNHGAFCALGTAFSEGHACRLGLVGTLCLDPIPWLPWKTACPAPSQKFVQNQTSYPEAPLVPSKEVFRPLFTPEKPSSRSTWNFNHLVEVIGTF